jgi:hypothetical protein
VEITTNDLLRDLEEEDIDDLDYYFEIAEEENGRND